MDDPFVLGDPAKHPARLGRAHAPKPERVGPSAAGRVIAIVAVAAAVGGGAFAVLKVTAAGGEQAADAARTAIDQISVAQDLAAQESVRRATFAAMALYAQDGTYPTPEALATYDPTITFTTGASTGANVASIATTPEVFAVAVASPSGDCLWSKVGLEGAVTFGSGTPCTGQAAMGAADPSW